MSNPHGATEGHSTANSRDMLYDHIITLHYIPLAILQEITFSTFFDEHLVLFCAVYVLPNMKFICVCDCVSALCHYNNYKWYVAES